MSPASRCATDVVHTPGAPSGDRPRVLITTIQWENGEWPRNHDGNSGPALPARHSTYQFTETSRFQLASRSTSALFGAAKKVQNSVQSLHFTLFTGRMICLQSIVQGVGGGDATVAAASLGGGSLSSRPVVAADRTRPAEPADPAARPSAVLLCARAATHQMVRPICYVIRDYSAGIYGRDGPLTQVYLSFSDRIRLRRFVMHFRKYGPDVKDIRFVVPRI